MNIMQLRKYMKVCLMPLYDFYCKDGHHFEKMIPLADFGLPVACFCGLRADRLISAPMFSVDQTGYDCPITGKWIGSRHAHEENLKKHDKRVLETGEKDDFLRAKVRDEVEFEKKVDETVARAIDQMPSAKREKLYNEARHSMIEVERK